MMHVVFAYWGRIDPEKWIDEIIDTILYMIAHQEQTTHTFQFDIRGIGSMQSDIERLACLYPWFIKYHGRVDHTQLMSDINSVHYALMPSLFLETFWLAALESCSHGIPVIWYAKWWLKQFILPHLDCHGWWLKKIVSHCTKSFDIAYRQCESQQVLSLSLSYKPDQRYARFCNIMWLHF